jgi:NADPH-dependent 2,4-dienoyl-CoA reductase/sulfur reductase-like enzyme
MQVVIIGGSDAGIAAALRVRELDPDCEVSVLLADRFPNYSICGLPYLLGGDVADWRDLAHRTREDLEATGMQLLLEHEAVRIDTDERAVHARASTGAEHAVSYDRLVIATGAGPVRPPWPGIDSPGVHVLHTMDHALDLQDVLDESGAGSAVIVGAGYIGLEMAEALLQRDIRVTVLQRGPEVLSTVDASLGAPVREELVRRGASVCTGTAVTAIEETGGGLRVLEEDGREWDGQLVLVCVGVQPTTDLAVAAGAKTGERGAIKVDQQMATSLPATWAAGDCAETHHRLLGRARYLPLGTTAHKQGRVAGENAIGGRRRFEGSLGTQVVKVFDLVVTRTGLRDQEAREAGFHPRTVHVVCDDHKAYYPGARHLHVAVTGDDATGQLLGAQIVGHRSSEVAKRIDAVAAALHARLAVDELNDLDLSYAPPLGSPWDPLQQAAQQWLRET